MIKVAILLVSVLSLKLYASTYEVYEPCSRQKILNNRSDAPRIKSYLSCQNVLKKKVKSIDSLSSKKPGFNFSKADQADFCVAVLDGHRTNSEVVFTGSLFYELNNDRKNKVRKDIQVSGEYVPRAKKFRALHNLNAGEVRPDKDSLRIYQEHDIGNFTDVKIDRKERIAHVKVKDISENYELNMDLSCQ